MKFVRLLICIMLASCSASESEKQNLQATKPSSDVTQKECGSDQAPCSKPSLLSIDELEAINREYFYTKPKARVYTAPSLNTEAPADSENTIVNGRQIAIYRRVAGQLYQIAILESKSETDFEGCWLTVDTVGQYDGKPLLKTICRYSGTGHFFEEQVYLIDANELKPVAYNVEKMQLPHKPLADAEARLTITNDAIAYTTTAKPRYCNNCKKSFSAQFEIKKTSSGELYFSYLKDSYKPFFTTESNVENKKGLVFYRAKSYSEAIKHFILATQLDVSNYEAFANLGLSYLKANKMDESIAASMQAYQGAAAPQKANAAYNIGLAYEKKSDFNLALKYYTDASRIKATDARKEAVVRMRDLVKRKNQ